MQKEYTLEQLAPLLHRVLAANATNYTSPAYNNAFNASSVNGTKTVPRAGVRIVGPDNTTDNTYGDATDGGEVDGFVLDALAEPFASYAAHAVAAGRGQISSPGEFWGGRVMRPFSRLSDGTTNVTVRGLSLVRGSVYAAVIRIWNRAGAFTQVMSDGVVYDDGESCVGGVQLVDVRDKNGALVTGIPQSRLDAARGVVDGTTNGTADQDASPSTVVARASPFFEL